MKKAMPFVIGAWLIFLCAILWQLTAATFQNSARSYDLLSRPPLVRLDQRVMQVVTLGHFGLYEDILDIWGIQVLMDRRVSKLPAEDVQKLVLDIARQNPRIETFYMLSCFTMTFLFHRPELCEPIILAGIRALPRTWRLPMVQGYIEMKEMKNPKAAALYYALASSRPRAPDFLKSLANKLAAKGDLSKAELDDTLSTLMNAKEGSQLERLLRERTATP